MVEQKKFSQILQEVIDALGISDKKFAADCGITDSTLFNYLGGKTVPNWNTLRNILRVYHVHPIWLLTGEGPMFADGREPPEQPDETPETASPPPVEVPAEAPTASPDTEKTPAEREMETFVRLMSGSGFSIDGLLRTIRLIKEIQQENNPDLHFFRLLINNVDRRTTMGKVTMAQLYNKLGPEMIFSTTIPTSAHFQQAEHLRETILRQEANGAASKAYRALAQEVLGLVGE